MQIRTSLPKLTLIEYNLVSQGLLVLPIVNSAKVIENTLIVEIDDVHCTTVDLVAQSSVFIGMETGLIIASFKYGTPNDNDIINVDSYNKGVSDSLKIIETEMNWSSETTSKVARRLNRCQSKISKLTIDRIEDMLDVFAPNPNGLSVKNVSGATELQKSIKNIEKENKLEKDHLLLLNVFFKAKGIVDDADIMRCNILCLEVMNIEEGQTIADLKKTSGYLSCTNNIPNELISDEALQEMINFEV